MTPEIKWCCAAPRQPTPFEQFCGCCRTGSSTGSLPRLLVSRLSRMPEGARISFTAETHAWRPSDRKVCFITRSNRVRRPTKCVFFQGLHFILAIWRSTLNGKSVASISGRSSDYYLHRFSNSSDARGAVVLIIAYLNSLSPVGTPDAPRT